MAVMILFSTLFSFLKVNVDGTMVLKNFARGREMWILVRMISMLILPLLVTFRIYLIWNVEANVFLTAYAY